MIGQSFVTAGNTPGLSVVQPQPVAVPGIVPQQAFVTSGAKADARYVTQGEPGPAGTDHGYLSYTAIPATPPMSLVAGQNQQVAFTAAEGGHIASTSLFLGHVFWDGSRIRPRAVDDTAILRLDLVSTSVVANGNIEISLDIGGTLGVIQTITRALKAPAGQAEHISESFPTFMAATFNANGGALWLETSVPVMITGLRLLVFPLSAARPA